MKEYKKPIPNVSPAKALEHVRRLCGKPGWPFLEEGHIELARVLSENANNLEHADQIITWFSESVDRCPTAKELKYELRGPMVSIPDVPKTCRIGECDGRGWRELFFIHTRISIPGGAAYLEKKPITRDKYNELVSKVDFEHQSVFSGVAKCGCQL
jgi:hypothetical protein